MDLLHASGITVPVLLVYFEIGPIESVNIVRLNVKTMLTKPGYEMRRL